MTADDRARIPLQGADSSAIEPRASSRVARWKIDAELYTTEAIFRACYKFTDRCYIRLERPDDRTVIAEFRPRDNAADPAEFLGAFANELIDQRIRADLARETKSVRDLIVAQAFIEADFDGHRNDGEDDSTAGSGV